MGWEIHKDADPKSVAYCLIARRRDDLADVSTVPQINNEHIYPAQFPHPPGFEQEAIVAFLDSETVREAIIHTLQARVPNLLGIYAFGSRITGTAGPDSDLDMAVLVAGYADPLALFDLAGNLADVAGCAVDLLDLRAASTVMQYQILTTGQCWWIKNTQAALFEAAVLSEKTALDTARAGLLADIQQRGAVYGR